MNEPAYVAETLAWCNERRAEDGKPPLPKLPKGRRRDGESCPCGKATGWYVDETDAVRDGRVIEIPDAVVDFVAEFDAGDLPQYDEDLA